MADIFPSYPPSLHPKALSFLIASLTDYCLSHGITVRPAEPSKGNHLASHAPVTLFPSLFPRSAWEQALKVQTTYNVLYARIANNEEWIGNIMNEYFHFTEIFDSRLAGVDDFVRDLWELYKNVKKEGIAQVLPIL
jgi:glutathione synthase